jgi:hypothetical protein
MHDVDLASPDYVYGMPYCRGVNDLHGRLHLHFNSVWDEDVGC